MRIKTSILALLFSAGMALAQQQGVTVQQDDASFTLSNGIVTAKIAKRNGDIISLVYKGIETLTDKSGHAGGYWSHDASSPDQIKQITIDPASNGGERGEVSVKGISNGRRLGRPAGLAAGAEGDFPADIEIRYALGKGDSGVYTYSILHHKPEYGPGSIGEARYCAKLAATFDWIHIDDRHNKYYPNDIPGEDKYVYTANQYQNRAYGFSSAKDKIGWFIINPTVEYLSGGPTKVEFLCHRDTTAVEAPCVLNYWRSSHYGGAVLAVKEGEDYTRVVGPFMIYVNSAEDPQAMFKDARAQAEKEAGKWPYAWVQVPEYAASKRSEVSGQLVINDPLAPDAKMNGKLMVGLTANPWQMTPAAGRNGQVPQPRTIDWQTDAKNYQYWGAGDSATGKFTVSDVRPGTYVLRAFADGIMGEFAKGEIIVPEGGQPLDLGKVEWKPTRRGKQLWQVGVPNRTATEFAGGDHYWDPETKINYAKLFPNDVNFIIGKSDPAKDWYYEHIPHNIDPNARVVPFSGVQAKPGNATPYKITFDLPAAQKGKAFLRIAFCTSSTRSVAVSVNDQPSGEFANLPNDSTITRHGIQGIWFERELSFDASTLKQGTNTLTLTVPSGNVNNGVIYDVVRLEVDDTATAMAE
jgi:rhamnogalacturonan endolyase